MFCIAVCDLQEDTDNEWILLPFMLRIKSCRHKWKEFLVASGSNCFSGVALSTLGVHIRFAFSKPRHHLTAFFKSPKIMTKDHKTIKSLTAARYSDISTATKTAAAFVGLKPYEFQAVVWEQVRKKQAPKQERQKITV